MRFLLLYLFLTQLLFSQTLHLSLSSLPSRINPILATDSSSGTIADWVFSSLLKYDKNGTIVGDMAKKFYFEDNKTLIIDIKKGITWHDGAVFTAKDVKFTFDLINSKEVVTAYKDEFRTVSFVEVINPYSLRIGYKHPYYKALHVWMMGILPYHLLKDEKNLMTSEFNRHPVGTGAYTLKSFEVGSDITLNSFKDYYLGEPHIKKVLYNIVPDSNAQFLMLKSKQLDIGGLSALQLERQLDDEFKSFYSTEELVSHAYTYVGFNLKSEKFKDVRVRRALTLAVNRKELSDILFFSHAEVCEGPFLPKTFAYNEDVTTPYNPELAKKLLKDAGFDDKNPFTFELVTSSNNPTRGYAAQIIQHQLAKVGVKMDIRVMEWQAFLNTVIFPGAFDAMLLGWGLSLMPDPYSIWHSDNDKPGGFNLIGYKNSDVDDLIVRSQKETNVNKLSIMYKKIYELIVKDYAYMFLYIPKDLYAISRKIDGIEPSIIGIMHNRYEWIKNE